MAWGSRWGWKTWTMERPPIHVLLILFHGCLSWVLFTDLFPVLFTDSYLAFYSKCCNLHLDKRKRTFSPKGIPILAIGKTDIIK